MFVPKPLERGGLSVLLRVPARPRLPLPASHHHPHHRSHADWAGQERQWRQVDVKISQPSRELGPRHHRKSTNTLLERNERWPRLQQSPDPELDVRARSEHLGDREEALGRPHEQARRSEAGIHPERNSCSATSCIFGQRVPMATVITSIVMPLDQR